MSTKNGIFSPFDFYEAVSDLVTATTHNLGKIDFITSLDITEAVLVNVSTLVETACTVDQHTYDYKGTSYTRSRITLNSVPSGRYYIKISKGLLNVRYAGFIEGSACSSSILFINECNDQNYAWDDDGGAFDVPFEYNLHEAKELEPDFERRTETFVNENGEIQKTTQLIPKNNLVVVLPREATSMLNAAASCDKIYIGDVTNQVKNVTIKKEDVDSFYSKFTITYEHDQLNDINGCCDELNLDTIITEGNGGGGDCTGFSVAISKSSGTLTAVPTGAPSTPTYRWYRNGVFLSTGTNLITNGVSGSYSVEAFDTGCWRTASLYISDPCEAMQVQPYLTGNDINANIVNPISGYTISVVLNGVEVATSLPYTALASGNYYVYATAGDCTKGGGVVVDLTNLDCSFTVSINENGNTLEAVTSASSPTYQWELETAAGRTIIGTAATQELQGQGIYFLTVTDGCSKEAYIYYQPDGGEVVNYLTKVDGYEHTVYGIDLLSITSPATQLEVEINGVGAIYTASAPTATNEYSINASGQLITWSAIPLSNGTLKIYKK